ncbi:MAG: gamma-glutamyl-phosphate reductase, partial [Treponema sp.]|nr:gamma-glutamyl-phosphate reductase [Treponema sp.]
MSNSLNDIFISLKRAQADLAAQNRAAKDKALSAAAAEIDKNRTAILEANARDVEQARKGG